MSVVANVSISRILRSISAAITLAALLVLAQPRTSADITGIIVPPTVIRVEEDWALVMGNPDANVSSPQVSTQMSRSADATVFCNFHLNSRDVPNFRQGGIQLQVWNGSTNLKVETSTVSSVLNTPAETITWTQYLRASDGTLYFGISAAASQTWDDFSGIEITVSDTSTTLDNYSSDYSQSNSGITYGANRVNSLTLVAVRKYLSNGLVVTDSTPHVIYSSSALGGS